MANLLDCIWLLSFVRIFRRLSAQLDPILFYSQASIFGKISSGEYSKYLVLVMVHGTN